MTEKEKRVQLYENEDIVLEQRGNKYYLFLLIRKIPERSYYCCEG